MLILPFAVVAWYIMPKTEAVAQSLPGWEKIKRMDLGGIAILIATLVLFILGFTQAPIQGWNSAIFIAPFVISLVLFVVFLVWEKKMPKGYSLLPHDIWSYPNIFPIILQASSIFMWFATAQLRIASYFQEALGDTAILAAVKLLPMGITALGEFNVSLSPPRPKVTKTPANPSRRSRLASRTDPHHPTQIYPVRCFRALFLRFNALRIQQRRRRLRLLEIHVHRRDHRYSRRHDHLHRHADDADPVFVSLSWRPMCNRTWR